MNNLLEVRDLKMHFSGVKAVDGVSFTVKEGSMLGIIGPNGSGKTTVYNALTGVYTPTAGQVVFNGTNITGKPMYDMVHYGIARTFQNLRFYRGMTVLENIMMGNYSNDRSNFFDAVFHTPRYKRYWDETKERAYEVLALVHLQDKANEYVGSLPYGVQKRVELCRALITGPKLLMLDEPTAGLNLNEASELIDSVLEVKEKRNLTVTMIEHNMKVMMSASDYIIVLDSGKKIAEGIPEEIQKNELVISAYLGKGGRQRCFLILRVLGFSMVALRLYMVSTSMWTRVKSLQSLAIMARENRPFFVQSLVLLRVLLGQLGLMVSSSTK